VGLFATVPVASAVERVDRLTEDRRYERDTITLGWEDRQKVRGRRQSDGGFAFAAALPRGTILRDGDCFVFDDPPRVVMVRELSEPVLVVRPRSHGEWALWAYHIGNSHQPLMITAEAIVCPDVPGMEQVLTYHGIPFTREQRPFNPATASPGHVGAV
jgi:urease accessory protein